MECPVCQQPIPDAPTVVYYCPACGHDLRTAPPAGWTIGSLDLRTIARRQRMLLWYVLGLLVTQWGFPVAVRSVPVYVPGLFLVPVGLSLAVLVLTLIGLLSLMAALRRHVVVRILYGILLFAPCFNLLILLLVNQEATSALRRAGLRVGFMGVKDADVVRVLGPYRCRLCGYSLIGNVSGRCPECGAHYGPDPEAATDPLGGLP